MARNDLTPQEIAALIKPENHPSRLSLDELDNLTADLSPAGLEEVVRILGLDEIARQLPPVIEKVFHAARLVAAPPPDYEGDSDVDVIVRNFDFDLNERAVQPNRVSTPPPPVSLVPRASTSRYIVSTRDRPERPIVTTSWFEAGSISHSVAQSTVRRMDSPRRSRKPRSAAYAVFYGGAVGAFTDWTRVSASITGHGVAIYSGFSSLEEAQAAFDYARAKGWTADAPSYTIPQALPPAPLPLPSSYDRNPLNSGGTHELWYAVCRGIVPGVYRSWLECSLNTTGIKGNMCNSFATRELAEKAYASAFRAGLTLSIPRVLGVA
ncbi:hypothetical protein C8F04DRAFT_1175263 [Mycena alexandri]|uniref:Ribonuclease H1 N-terminal domain-containing protein n=1 Tax=Mycena alexandri TaxID=1745969 RepID=A0AAD6XCL5_9AGAR|nr:hypothetical protein C8F04DRAFT_1175263 [Mycena alexandri]